MTAVGRAASAVVEEVRANSRNAASCWNPEARLWPRRRHADPAAIREDDPAFAFSRCSRPSCVSAVRWIAGPTAGLNALGAMLLGVIVTGLFVASSDDFRRRRRTPEVIEGAQTAPSRSRPIAWRPAR